MYQPQTLGPVIKSILDRGEHKNDKWKKEIQDVEKNLVMKLKELCRDKYQEFIVSIEGMVEAKSLIAKLREQIMTFQNLQAGVLLEQNVKKLEELKECRLSVKKATQQVKGCLQVAELVSNCCNFRRKKEKKSSTITIKPEVLQELLDDSAEAKKGLNERLFSTDCQQLCANILERFHWHLNTIVVNDFTDWLHLVEINAVGYGKREISKLVKPNNVLGTVFPTWEQIIDVSPVKNMVLVEGESFGKSYLNNYRRKVYLDTAKQKFSSEGDMDLVKFYENSLLCIVGHFIVDRSLWMQCELFDFAELNDLGNEVCRSLQKRLTADIQSLKESKKSFTEILRLKNFMVSINTALSIFDELKPECLLLSFVECYPVYQKQLLRNLKNTIAKLFLKDENYTRMVVYSKEDFLERVVCFGLHRLLPEFKEKLLISENEIDDIDFPLEMPTSATMPDVAAALEEFVENFSLYVSGLPMNTTISLAVALGNAFKVVISETRASIERVGRNFSVLAQTRQNNLALMLLLDHLEDLGKLHHEKEGEQSIFHIKTETRIQTFQHSIQNIFTEQLKSKVVEFMTLTPEHLIATKPNEEPSMWPDDLMLYLTHTLTHQLQFTERGFRDELLLAVFNAVKMELVECWCQAKQWNVIGAWNLLVDVECLEDRVLDMNTEETINGIEEVFPGYLKNLLNLLLGGNLAQILDSKETRWSNIPRKKLIHILERFQAVEAKTRCPKRIKFLDLSTVIMVLTELRKS